jgi:hypothetical protein
MIFAVTDRITGHAELTQLRQDKDRLLDKTFDWYIVIGPPD